MQQALKKSILFSLPHEGLFHYYFIYLFMQKFSSFFASEALNLSVGYLAGLCASTLVSRFFVKKGLVNIWGLASRREALQKDDYEWLLFIASYVIGLGVLLLVQYAMRRLRGQRMVEE